MVVDRVTVSLDLESEKIEVGELVQNGRQIHFKYYPSFLQYKLNISPIKIPTAEKVYTAEWKPFDGLYGVFNDSLPDGWGRLLLDRSLVAKGLNPRDLTALDRLLYIGNHGMGALTYAPTMEEGYYNNQFRLDTLADEATAILNGTESALLEELFTIGGSSGGARPKVFVGYNQRNGDIIYGEQSLPEGYEHWIIKFPSSFDRPDIANIEYAYHLMAKQAGIDMTECRLFTSETGRQFFGTRRFDRKGDNRFHVHSASGIMHDDFRYSQLDYGHLMDCAFRLEKHVGAYEKVLRLAAFNVMAHNRDDHSKNFSFLMDRKGKWRFSPAYDLTYSSSGHGQHSTLVNNEGKHPTREHLLGLAKIFSVKKAQDILDQVAEAIGKWEEFAAEAMVSEASYEETQRSVVPL